MTEPARMAPYADDDPAIVEAHSSVLRSAGRADISKDAALTLYITIAEHMTNAHALALVHLGEILGLFTVLADGPVTASQLGTRAGIDDRYAAAWADAMVAASYVEFDAPEQRYFLTGEQQLLFTVEGLPSSVGGLAEAAVGGVEGLSTIADCFRSGAGLPASGLSPCVVRGVQRMWAGMHAQQMPLWLGQVDGVVERLSSGGTIADLGCGTGTSTVALASTFPECKVVAFEDDVESAAAARALVESEGLAHRVSIEARPLHEIGPPETFDLVYAFAVTHHFGDTEATLRAVRESLRRNGVLLWCAARGDPDPLVNRGGAGRMFATMRPFFALPIAISTGTEGPASFVDPVDATRLTSDAGFSKLEMLPLDIPIVSVFAAHP